MTPLERAQDVNAIATYLLEAYDRLDDVRVIGPGQHNLVSDAQANLVFALERLLDISENSLAPIRRISITQLGQGPALRRMRGRVMSWTGGGR